MTTAMADRQVGESIRDDYLALTQGAALQIRNDAGIIELTEDDRTDFLHRMTTNEINKLPAGQATVTILTNPTARSLFAFSVVNRGENLLLLPAPERAAALVHYLHGQIFFMDAVKVTNRSGEYRRLRLMGTEAGATLAVLGFEVPADVPGAVLEHDGIVAVVENRYDLPGIELIVPADRVETVTAALVEAGARRLTSEEAYTVRRIELGRPLPGREIVETYNPLESGMAWVCNESKGCYTGQEILARQVTYDKITKTLVGLVADHAMTAGATVMQGEKRAGTVTSAAYSIGMDKHIALAVISRPHNQAGTKVSVEEIDATVAELPLLG